MKLPRRHPFPVSSAFLLLALLAGAEQRKFDVSIWPENPVVEHGGSLWLNCSTSCLEASAKGGLETSLIKTRKDSGTGWARFQLMNITEWESAVKCSFSCYGEEKSVHAKILVYQMPEKVAWYPVPKMEAGKVYNLTCQVANVAPIQNLKVTLRKGKEELRVETFESHRAPEAADVLVTHTMRAEKNDHGKEATCHAALDLRPEGQLLKKASLSKVLKVYDFPADPQLHALRYTEANSNLTVQCDVVGAFPIKEARFDLSFAEERLDFSVSRLEDTVRAQAHLTSVSTGNHTLKCTVTLGPVTKSAIGTVHVYSFPEPSLVIYPPQILANNPLTIICDSSATWPLSASLQIKNDPRRILASSDQVPLQFTLKAQEEYDGKELVCQVEMAIGGDSIIKYTSANLTVFYVPEMDDSMCPSNRTWVEGARQALHCMAKGNPKPTVTCSKEGLLHHSPEKEEPVIRSLAGIYNCTAVNEFGSSTRTVSVLVEYGPELGESDCPSNQTWLENTLQQLHCQAEGFPIPDISCMKDGKVLDTRRLQNATQSHTGDYFCNASNTHGSRSKMVTVQVEYKPDMDDSSCPHNWTWTVGAEQMFTCFAWGNPEPTVECIKDGIAYSSSGVLHVVTREYAGTYLCTATNRHGSNTRAVSIQVEYKPEMDDSRCPSHWTLVEGAPPTFDCKAEGLPPPDIVCTKDGIAYLLSQGQGIPFVNGTFWCNATNIHGTVAKLVTAVVETTPTIDESTCPSNQTWLEGTLQSLACKANGIPTPLVSCVKEGVTEEFYREQNISRNDSGIYQCKATNVHGTKRWMLNVQVEYRPVISILAVNSSRPIRRGENFSITCHADGSPAASFSWRVPQASNLNYLGSNSTVTVVGADGHNSGVYECTASNKHGQQHSQVEIRVEDHGLYIIVVIAIAGATMLVLGGMAGFIYYLKSTACKKGEYNVRDAENSTEATCLNRERSCDGDVYGIQLTRT